MGRSAVNINPFLFADSLEGVAFLAIKSIIDFYFRSITRDDASEVPRTEIVNTLGNEILLELYANKARTEPSEEFMAMEKAIANKYTDQRKREKLRRRRQLLIKQKPHKDNMNIFTVDFFDKHNSIFIETLLTCNDDLTKPSSANVSRKLAMHRDPLHVFEPEIARAMVTQRGLDWDALIQEYDKDGSLSESSYEKLISVGFSKEMVNESLSRYAQSKER